MNFDHNLWGKIVPDGPRFCHWGGKQISKQLAEKLKLSKRDKVLDLCCGQGGLTDYLTKAGLIIGIDTSVEAIVEAQKTVKNKKLVFMTADARSLPFPNNCFDKIISQDADAWMHSDKKLLIEEIHRVLRPNGIFVWQSYATNENPIRTRTRKLLINIGYKFNDLPYYPEIKNMFTDAGFSIIEFRSLHSLYYKDNIRMLKKALEIKNASKNQSINNYIKLLEAEKKLFKKRLWTGVLVIGKKLST